MSAKTPRRATIFYRDIGDYRIAFITNSGWLESNGLDGFRKHLEKDFSKVYAFNLRGAIRGRSGESAKRERQNVFNIMTGVAITVLVKKGENK